MSELSFDPSDPLPLAREALEVAQRVAEQHDDAQLRAHVDECEARLLGPLRVALAGKVKAGKSTLVNAFLADELAPTDAGECTMVTTWYQHGRTPATRVVATDGTVRELPFRRQEGRFVVGLGGLEPDRVTRVEVDWPSPFLQQLTLIDTPGIDSITTEASDRTTRLLLGEERATSVDAVIYLMRHRHAVDLTFVGELARNAPDEHGAATTLVVLSRADELGGGRIESLISAQDIARSYAEEPLLKAHSLGVVPVAGLLAQGARTFRQDDFDVLSALTGVDRDERDAMLISADRYTRVGAGGTPEQRAALVRRVGLFGLRLGAALIRQGFATPGDLAAELGRRSGLGEIEEVLREHFVPRSRIFIARNALATLEAAAGQCTEPARAELLRACDRFWAAGSHGLVEMGTLLRLREASPEGLDPQQREQALRILGGAGTSARQRVGVGADAGAEEALAVVDELTAIFRDLALSPQTWRPTRRVAEIVLATLDRIAVRLPEGAPQAAT
jgi:hypothetical protein